MDFLLADMFIMARAEGLSSAREGFDCRGSCVAAGDDPTESHGLRRSSTVHLVDVIWETAVKRGGGGREGKRKGRR